MPRTIIFARLLLAGAMLVSAGAAFAAPASAGAKPAIGPWGFDLTAIDSSVQPGDDFFRYANGNWLKNTEIPSDRATWGMFALLRDRADQDVQALVGEIAAKEQAPGTPAQKIADFYRAFRDTARIEKLGLEPFRADLDRIAAIASHEQAAALVRAPGFAGHFPVGIGVNLDAKDPDRYRVFVGQGGLGMPNRDYYLKDDARFADTRAKYREYVEKLLTLAGYPKAGEAALAIAEVEKKIAEAQWPIEKLRNSDLTYNPRKLAELKTHAPDFPWDAAFEGAGVAGQDIYMLAHPEPVAALARIFRATPVATWRAYLTFHYLDRHAEVMPAAFDAAWFDFHGRTLDGQPSRTERGKRAIQRMNGLRGEQPLAKAVGELYVQRHFPPEAKEEVLKLVRNLLSAYVQRIDALEWMTPETRKAARRKADTVRIKIGYPDKPLDLSTLEIRAGDAAGNARRIVAWDWERNRARLGKSADREEWWMSPHTVNAYYRRSWNEIVFPAAILQPPFFDRHADPAVNYGGIGSVIGHEMGHGYDDQGSKADEKGILRTWWKPEDVERFKAKVEALAKQYSSYEPLPGLRINGNFTSGENIGDLGGLAVAHAAYRISLGGKAAPVLDGFTGDQRFFLGWAQIWRAKYREPAMRRQLLSDTHSPPEFRVSGSVRNVDAWYEAFGVKSGNKLYLPPGERVRIW